VSDMNESSFLRKGGGGKEKLRTRGIVRKRSRRGIAKRLDQNGREGLATAGHREEKRTTYICGTDKKRGKPACSAQELEPPASAKRKALQESSEGAREKDLN